LDEKQLLRVLLFPELCPARTSRANHLRAYTVAVRARHG
jgi:hypothetical protein